MTFSDVFENLCREYNWCDVATPYQLAKIRQRVAEGVSCKALAFMIWLTTSRDISDRRVLNAIIIACKSAGVAYTNI